MGFVTPALLAGTALIAVPIVLHLIMRREAQQLKFPALRFVQQRRNLNQHRLRLRHLLLLALRCAIIALLAFALARPSLRGSGAVNKDDAPVATALVFDNSLRMQYEWENQSSLEHAKELAGWLLDQLPNDSLVTVVDRAGRQRGQDLDRTAAELRVERLDISPVVRPMQDALSDAARWLEDKPDHRGEIYVFTDMATEAWPDEAILNFKQSLDELAGANVYLIDVGVLQPANVGLGALRLSDDELPPGGLLQIHSDLTSIGGLGEAAASTDEYVVELYLSDGDSPLEKRGQQSVVVDGDRPAPIEFSLSGLKLGTHQGSVRIAANDALPCDDARYFTIEVRPPRKVLLLGENEVDTLFLREALAPTTGAELLQSKFECTTAQYVQLDQLPLADYSAICLTDPPSLSNESWQRLAEFTEHGGGVGVFLGRRATREVMNGPDTQQLLPAKLRWQSRDATYLRPVAVEHPALSELSGLVDVVPWSEFPVFKYWELEAGDEEGHVVASYANGKPALVERRIGSGIVLMMTTTISDPAHGDPWNLLPTGPDPWPFLALANGITQYLVGAQQTQVNYLAGQTVVLPLTINEQVTNYVLLMPDSTAVRQSLTPGTQDLSIATTEALGNYRVRAGGRQERLDRGFSVNLPPDVTRLDRAKESEVVSALGDERVRVARTREEIEVRVGLARTGRELFPTLILAMVLALAAESLLANRFYVGAASRVVTQRGGDGERGRGGEDNSDEDLPVSPSPPLPVFAERP
jgi:hypothetical protein